MQEIPWNEHSQKQKPNSVFGECHALRTIENRIHKSNTRSILVRTNQTRGKKQKSTDKNQFNGLLDSNNDYAPQQIRQKKNRTFSKPKTMSQNSHPTLTYTKMSPQKLVFWCGKFSIQNHFYVTNKANNKFFLSVFHSDWACLVANLWLLLLPFFVRLRAETAVFFYLYKFGLRFGFSFKFKHFLRLETFQMTPELDKTPVSHPIIELHISTAANFTRVYLAFVLTFLPMCNARKMVFGTSQNERSSFSTPRPTFF